MNKNPRVKSYLKTCRATYRIGPFDYSNTEIMHVFRPGTDYKSNIFLPDLLSKMKLEGELELNDECGSIKLYFSSLESVPNIIRKSRSSLNSFTNYEKGRDMKLVEVFGKSDQITYPPYFVDIIMNKNSAEKNFWKQTDFYADDDKFILIPNVGSDNRAFNLDYVSIWKNLKTYAPDNYHLIEELLYTLSFVIFIKSPDLINNKYRTINDFTKDDVNLLKELRQFIYDFYSRFIPSDVMIKDKIKAYISSDLGNEFFIIKIQYINIYSNSDLVSVTDIHKDFSLDDLINILETNSGEITHYKLVQKEQKGGVFYKHEQVKKMSGNFIERLFGKGIGMKDIRVISEYYKGNRIHGYCTMYFIVYTGGKYYELSIKSITAAVIRKWGELGLEFREKYYSSLSNISNPGGNKKNNYNVEGIRIIFEKLPAYCETYLNEIPAPKITYIIPLFEETMKMYKDRVNRMKHDISFYPDVSLVIHLLWKSSIRKLYSEQNIINDFELFHREMLFGDRSNVEKIGKVYGLFYDLTKKILDNPVMSVYIIDKFVWNKNYTINARMVDFTAKNLLTYEYLINKGILSIDKADIGSIKQKLRCDKITDYNKKLLDNLNFDKLLPTLSEQIHNNIDYTDIYILWYVPFNMYFTDYEKAIKMMDHINSLYEDMITNKIGEYTYENISHLNDLFSRGMGFIGKEKKENQIRIHREYIHFCSNFESVFKSEDFVHTVRDVDQLNKNQILDLINKFKHADRYSICSYHYPSDPLFGMFHMHFYSLTHVSYGGGYESFGVYKDINVKRANYWFPYKKNRDYEHVEKMPIVYGGFINPDNVSKKDLVTAIIQNTKDRGYPDDIVEYVKNNIDKTLKNIFDKI